MSFQNSTEIQTLLEAEKEAQKIVYKARQYRTQRIKDARAEAQKEIEEYKKEKEEEFKRFESGHSAKVSELEAQAAKEVEGKLTEIKDAGERLGNKVVEQLIKDITDVKPQPHRNKVSNAA